MAGAVPHRVKWKSLFACNKVARLYGAVKIMNTHCFGIPFVSRGKITPFLFIGAMQEHEFATKDESSYSRSRSFIKMFRCNHTKVTLTLRGEHCFFVTREIKTPGTVKEKYRSPTTWTCPLSSHPNRSDWTHLLWSSSHNGSWKISWGLFLSDPFPTALLSKRRGFDS